MRRWLAPTLAAAATAALTLSLVGPRDLPSGLLRVFADNPVDDASTPLLIEGGYSMQIAVDHGDPALLAGRLSLAGLEIVSVGADRIVARSVGFRTPAAILVETGLWLPFTVEADEPLAPGRIAEIRRDGTTITVVPTDPGAVADQIVGLRNPPGEWLPTACSARAGRDEIVLEHCDGSWQTRIPTRMRPARDGALDLIDADPITAAVSDADVWSARAVMTAAMAALVFALFTLAVGRRRLVEDIARDEKPGGSRGLVLGALALTAAAVGVGLVRGDAGPFIDSIHAGLLGLSLDGTSPLDLGYFVVAGGFVAAMLATLLWPSWRRDLICDRSAGARLIGRGAGFTAVGVALLFAAPAIDNRLDLVLPGWTAANTAIYSAVAVGYVAAVLALGSRALGGAWVCAALAVLIPACARAAGHLDANLVAGLALAAGVCAATVALLSRQLGRTAGLRAPLGGLLPVSVGAGAAAIAAALAGGLTPGGRLSAQLGVAVPLAVGAALFELRIRRGLGGARVSSAKRSPDGAIAAIGLTLLYVAALLAVEAVARHLYVATFAVLAALTCAALMDVAGELRARWRRPTLTPAWHIHQPQLAGLVERALESRGLSCHMRGVYLRTCLGIFGAFVPIAAMVDRDRVDEAREVIDSVLG